MAGYNQSDFQAAFVPKQRQFFSHNSIKALQMKAADFLMHKGHEITSNPNSASLVRKSKKHDQRVTKLVLPHVCGNEITVTNDMLPLGFLSYETSPQP